MKKNTYKEPRSCECGYVTIYSSAWSTHKRRCPHHLGNDSEKEQFRERVQSLEQQLSVKDEQLNAATQQLAAARAPLSATTAFVLVAALKRLAWPGRADWPIILSVGALQLPVDWKAATDPRFVPVAAAKTQ